jgi:hypothetical protein
VAEVRKLLDEDNMGRPRVEITEELRKAFDKAKEAEFERQQILSFLRKQSQDQQQFQKAGQARKFSLRKRSGEIEYRGTAGGQKSNRKLPGQASKRRDLPAATKLSIAEDMAEHMSEFSSQSALPNWAKKKYSLSRSSLKKIFEKREQWQIYTKVNKLGKGSRHSWRGKGIRTQRSLMKDQSLGVRAKGSGAKQQFPWSIEALKTWLATERSYGHNLSKKDLLDQFSELLQERAAQTENEIEKKLCLERIEKLSKSAKYRETQTIFLMAKTGARFLRPHQVTSLSALEEQIRAQLTFQSYDHAQWLLAFSPEETLERFIAQPKVFRRALKKTWLGFSDQVPFWVKTVSDKSLFAEHETEVVHQNVLRDAAKQRAGLGSKSTELVLKKAETQIVVAKPSAADQGGQSQLRKQAESQDDKYRTTYEARQAISGTDTKLGFFGEQSFINHRCKPKY